MAVRIKFDNNHVPLPPTFILANRNGNKLGYIPALNINFGDHLNSASELQFTVPKEENGVVCALWDEIIDFKLIWCPEWDVWFEIKVEVTDGDHVSKSITAKFLGEAELSQINLYGVEINTETDIARDDYVVTVLYNPEDARGSLLDRITEKAPHYSIGYVDASIANIQRTFTFDGTSILDALYSISDEIDCLFIIDSGSKEDGSISRTINAYDLESVCLNCGHRGVYHGACPECGSSDCDFGFGHDTNIYISSENLTDEVTFSSDTDSVKNCFRLVAGDDLMTATVINCNPSGSGYLWYFTDDMKNDMSEALRNRLDAYQAELKYYSDERPFTLPSSLVSNYNKLIRKYQAYKSTLNEIPNPVTGYSSLMNAYYDTIDFEMLLRNELMPSVELSGTTAQIEAAKLVADALSPTAVMNLSACSAATASSAVLAVAKQVVKSAYQVKVNNSALDGVVWTGNFTVTNYADEDDTATSPMVSVTLTQDQRTYLYQRIEKVLADADEDITDITVLFKLDLVPFEAELKKYCLTSLSQMHDICQSCLDILIDQGIADNKTWANTNPNLYMLMYVPYYNKLNSLKAEIKLRESELALVTGDYDANGGLLKDGIQSVIERLNETVQAHLDTESYLGAELFEELAAYRREDTYENNNFISDGLNNQEVFAKALEFLELAKSEIYKSATLQHSITSTLKNLLVMKEFAPITDAFEIGNWLSISVADKVYRLRLISYEIDYDNLESLSVEFSDVVETVYGKNDIQSILKSASSMATSYNAVQRQAKRGDRSLGQLTGFAANGMSLADVRIINNGENQNITMDERGILCRMLDPHTGLYEDRQLKIINRGLYLTDDGWLTSRAGIGLFKFYDPIDREEKLAYGVVADALVGNLVLSETVGVYNKENTIKLDKDGFTLVSTNDGENNTVFRIQRKTVIDGEESVEDVIYFDDAGNANFKGIISATSIVSDRTLAEILLDIDKNITRIDAQFATNQSDSTAPTSGWSTTVPAHQSGYFVWQRMAMTSENGTTYTTPVCVTGRDGSSITVSGVSFAQGTSGTTAPSTGWQTTVPTVDKGKWLWTRTTFSDGNSVCTCAYMGVDGVDGNSVTVQSATKTGGVTTVMLIESNGSTHTLTINDGEDGADGAPGADGDSAYMHIAWANSANGVTDFSKTVSAGKSYIGVYTDDEATGSNLPADYSWTKIKGEDGTNGTSVTVSTVEYAQGNSGTTAPSTGWQSSIPSVAQGKWLWCRTTYSNGSTASICSYMGTDGVLMEGYEVATLEEIEEALG